MTNKVIKKVSPKYVKRYFNRVGILLCLYILLVIFYPLVINMLIDHDIINYQVDELQLRVGIYYFFIVLGSLMSFLILIKMADIRIESFWRSCKYTMSSFIKDVLMMAVVVFTGIFISSMILNYFGLGEVFIAPIGVININLFFEKPLFIFLYIVVAPFIEEFCFRGVLMRSLSRFGNRFAIFTVAVIYALCHSEAGEVLPALFMSLLLANITLKNRSIYPAILVHIALNLIFFGLFYIPELYLHYLAYGIFVLYFIAIVLLMTKNYQLVSISRSRDLKSLLSLFFSSFGIILAIILLIAHTILIRFLP